MFKYNALPFGKMRKVVRFLVCYDNKERNLGWKMRTGVRILPKKRDANE